MSSAELSTNLPDIRGFPRLGTNFFGGKKVGERNQEVETSFSTRGPQRTNNRPCETGGLKKV